ncbi:hypothetical protein [Treponema socranskii]|uniref:hypothetical protein n=1 Tax=Treponema socranskii TaxID=53419 RepID=UPI003D8BBA8E
MNDEAKKHNQSLPGMGGVFNIVNFQLYHYAGNNPVKYVDPDGKAFCFVTAGIGFGIGFAYGAYKSYTETGSVDLKEAVKDALIGGAIGLGFGATAAVALTGSATASVTVVATSAKAAVAVTVGTTSTMAAKGWGGLQKAGEYGIQTYSQLRNALTKAGEKGYQVHRLIGQRFAKTLGIGDVGKMPSVVLTPEEHQKFTNAWRALIPYGEGTREATRGQIIQAAKQIYKEFPELLKAALKTIEE